MNPADATHVVFVGAMGSGKTTIGSLVAVALGRRFVDNDDTVERTTGSSAAELARRDGIEALHRTEAAVLLASLRESDPSVIAAAASTVTDAAVRRALSERAWVVWLRADSETLVARLPESPTRPFGATDPVRLVQEQARAREHLFAEVADVSFATDRNEVDAVVAAVLGSLADGRGGIQDSD